MAKCNPAYNPKLGDRTVAGSSPGAPGEVTTKGDVEEMMETYAEIENSPPLSPEQVERLLPSHAWYDKDAERLWSQPDGWSQKFGLSDSRKDVLQYRAGGHTKEQIVEIKDCSTTHVDNTLHVFDFLLHNEDRQTSNFDEDVSRLLLKTFVGPERKHPKYATEVEREEELTCDDCGGVFGNAGALAKHRKDSRTDCGQTTVTADAETTTADVSGGPDPSPSTSDQPAVGDGGTATMETMDDVTTDQLDDVLCVSEVMDKDEWRNLVRVLLNAKDDNCDKYAERLMDVVANGPFDD